MPHENRPDSIILGHGCIGACCVARSYLRRGYWRSREPGASRLCAASPGRVNGKLLATRCARDGEGAKTDSRLPCTRDSCAGIRLAGLGDGMRSPGGPGLWLAAAGQAGSCASGRRAAGDGLPAMERGNNWVTGCSHSKMGSHCARSGLTPAPRRSKMV